MSFKPIMTGKFFSRWKGHSMVCTVPCLCDCPSCSASEMSYWWAGHRLMTWYDVNLHWWLFARCYPLPVGYKILLETLYIICICKWKKVNDILMFLWMSSQTLHKNCIHHYLTNTRLMDAVMGNMYYKILFWSGAIDVGGKKTDLINVLILTLNNKFIISFNKIWKILSFMTASKIVKMKYDKYKQNLHYLLLILIPNVNNWNKINKG